MRKFLTNYFHIQKYIQEVHSIVTSIKTLTDLAKYTLTPEIFLLASAALANLTFLDGGCVGAMRAAGTARVLIRAAHDNPNLSVFTKDQVSPSSKPQF